MSGDDEYSPRPLRTLIMAMLGFLLGVGGALFLSSLTSGLW